MIFRSSGGIRKLNELKSILAEVWLIKSAAGTGPLRAASTEALPQKKHAAPNVPVRIQTDTLETALALCRAGLGVTLSPGKLLGDQALNAQRTCYLLSRHRNEHALAVCYRETSHLSRSMQTFVEIAQRLYHADEAQ